MKKICKNLLDTFLIIFINFFVADLNIIFIWLLIMMLAYFAFLSYLLNIDWIDLPNYYLVPLIIIAICIFIIKFISLPLLYSFLSKNSQSRLIKKFIYALKNKIIVKFFILFLSIIPCLIFNMLTKPDDILFSFLVFCVISGLFGSYLFLFLWWEVEKWWQKDCDKWYSSKRIKNTQLYLKISKIFNKIQDFNYQNLKKCQKIVFVIVTLIFKWSGKVGLKINKVLKTKII